MANVKVKDYTGYSTSSINDAVDKALEQAMQPQVVAVVETRSSKQGAKNTEYHVTITMRDD